MALVPVKKEARWLELGYYNLNLADHLGQGNGIVYMGSDKRTERKVAVKKVKIEHAETGGDAAKELKVFMMLPKHENLVAFLDFYYLNDAIWLVMEYCDMGTLDQYYNKNKPIDIATSVSFMCQIASAIAHMHSLPEPIVHRDLKPSNILLKNCGGMPVIKVADFGLAMIGPKKADMQKSFSMRTRCGTFPFMAPEQFTGNRERRYTASVDVFSMGIVFLGMLTYEENADLTPTIDMDHIGLVLKMDPTVKVVPDVTESDDPATRSLKELFGKMLVADPSQRSKAVDVSRKLTEIFDPLEPNLPPATSQTEETKAETGQAPRPTPHDKDTEEKPRLSKEEERHLPADLIYHLLQQAAHEDVKQRLRKEEKEDEEEEESDETTFSIPLDVPLRHLLSMLQSDEVQDEKKGQEHQFKVGDRVQIDDCGGDTSKAKRLQEFYGGWNPRMKTYLGKNGTFKGRTLNAVKVIFDDGTRWAFNPVLVKKIDDDGRRSPPHSDKQDYGGEMKSKFQRYDIVRVTEDKGRAQKLQKGHGGWNNKMSLSLGLKAIVNRVDKDGDVFCECINGDDWVFNPELLVQAEPPRDAVLEPGDFVLVIDDVEELMKLHSSGLTSDMATALGHTAIIKKVQGEYVLLECSQTTLLFNRKAVKLVAKAEEMMVAILKKKFMS